MKFEINKITALMITVLILFISMPLNANAETQKNFNYSVFDDQATILKCDQTAAGKLTIPDTLGGFPVTGIGEEAFNECSGLTSITIPNSVTSIENEAFEYCTGLTSITIPDSVITIGNRVFFGCDGLKSITIPSSVKSIGKEAFSEWAGLTSINVSKTNMDYTSENGVLFNKLKTELIRYPEGKTGAYTILNSVKSISSFAFEYCKGLKIVNIPSSVMSIGESAFRGCFGLTSITIPSGVTSIGTGAFEYCEALKNVNISGSVASIGKGAFNYTAWLDNQPVGLIYAGKVVYCYKGYIPDNTAIVLKSGTKGIAGGAFQPKDCDADNPGLIGVRMPNTITNIGEQAFYNCTGLKKITIPKSVVSIGEQAFFGCTGLKNITIPKRVVSIGEQAFGYYIKIEYAVKIPGLSINCFANSTGLKYATENGLTYNILPDLGDRIAVPVVISAAVAFLAVAVTAVFIIAKKKKKKT